MLRSPATASTVAILVGGLGAPLLFFAPTLAIGAVCLGCMLGPVRRTMWNRALIVLVAAVGVACIPLSKRVWSEVARSKATMARYESQVDAARHAAERAVDIDDRNPRAWIELGLACEALRDLDCALDAYQKAAVDLPSDGVRYRWRVVERTRKTR